MLHKPTTYLTSYLTVMLTNNFFQKLFIFLISQVTKYFNKVQTTSNDKKLYIELIAIRYGDETMINMYAYL